MNDVGAALLREGRPFVVAGVVLAAGAGVRMGGPKGLILGSDGVPWVATAVTALVRGGCAPVLVVTGAAAGQVQALVPTEAGTEVVLAQDWSEGMGASLRAGLRAAQMRAPSAVAAIVTLVDTPGVTPAGVSRLGRTADPTALARAGYHGSPGHPVLIGREHWAGVIESAVGDAGARHYLAARDVVLVESADIASGEDFDTWQALNRLGRISWAP